MGIWSLFLVTGMPHGCPHPLEGVPDQLSYLQKLLVAGQQH